MGNTWSAKTGKLVDKTWNTIVYEWDESSFSSPAYNTEVTFKFYDQNGILSDSLGYTGDERVYVHTISSYLNDGGSAAVAAGKTIAYSAYYKTGGLHGSVRYTTSLIEYVMFQTAIFNFKDQDGELVGTGLEKVYVHSVAAYFMDEDPITVPLDSTIGYSAYYTTGGLHGTVIHKTITNTVEIIDVLYQTFTFVFKDQDGNLLAGTGNERVYLHSISSYVNKNIEVSVPLDSSIAYSAYYTSSGLHGPVQHKTIDNSVEVIDVAYQIFSFEFKDQNGD